jgi:hypothetical protein
MLTVMLGVMATCLDVMMLGVAGMAVGAVRMMRCLLVVAGLMMFGGFTVMLRRVLVMFGGFLMMLDASVVAHISLPVI